MRKSHAAARQSMTAGQLREIAGLYADERVTCEDAQDFIRHHTPFAAFPRPGVASTSGLKTRLREALEEIFWEVPGDHRIEQRVEDAVEILAPVYWMLDHFDLGPAAPDLELVCRQGITWRANGFRGLKIVTPSLIQWWIDVRFDTPEWFQHAVSNGFSACDDDCNLHDWALEAGHEVQIRIGAQVVREMQCGSCTPHNLMYELVRAGLDVEPGEDTGLHESLNDLPVVVAVAVEAFVVWAINFRLNGMEALSRMLWPVIQVILKGNVPLGFTDEGDLVVLCGDAE